MVSMVIFILMMLLLPVDVMAQDKESDTNYQASSGCYYKGKYHHGNWEDGCEHLCTCLNPHTGHYKCRRRCPRHRYLPRNCFLVLPPGGKCCKEPRCFGINSKHMINEKMYPVIKKYLNDSLKLDSIQLLREKQWVDSNKTDLYNRNPDIFENPLKRADNQKSGKPSPVQESDDSRHGFVEAVTHTYFVTQGNSQIVADRLSVSSSADKTNSGSDSSLHSKTLDSKMLISNHNATFPNNTYIFESANSFVPSDNNNENSSNSDSESSQDNPENANHDSVVNETLSQYKIETSKNNSSENNTRTQIDADRTIPIANAMHLQIKNSDTQAVNNPNNGTDDNDQLDNDVSAKETRLRNLVILNKRILDQLKKLRATNYKLFGHSEQQARTTKHYNTVNKLSNSESSSNDDESPNSIENKQTTEINVLQFSKSNETFDKISERNASTTSENPSVSRRKHTRERTSVTFKPIIPLYTNTSLKYKDREWGKFVRELTNIAVEVNRLKKNKPKVTETSTTSSSTTQSPTTTTRANFKLSGIGRIHERPRQHFYGARPRQHFYGTGRHVNTDSELKLQILDKEYITQRKTQRKLIVKDCIHDNNVYKPGDQWKDRCNQTCVCESTGQHECVKERCLSPNEVPPGCILKTRVSGCCGIPNCTRQMNETSTIRRGTLMNKHSVKSVLRPSLVDKQPAEVTFQPSNNVKFIRTSTGIIRLENPQNGGKGWVGTFVPNVKNSQKAFCIYKNRKYITGALWNDGCNLCQCINGMFGRYTCHFRCPALQNIPNNCSLHVMSTRQCCPIIKCNNRIITTTLRNMIISPILQSYFDIQSRTTVSPFDARDKSRFKSDDMISSDIQYLKGRTNKVRYNAESELLVKRGFQNRFKERISRMTNVRQKHVSPYESDVKLRPIVQTKSKGKTANKIPRSRYNSNYTVSQDFQTRKDKQ